MLARSILKKAAGTLIKSQDIKRRIGSTSTEAAAKSDTLSGSPILCDFLAKNPPKEGFYVTLELKNKPHQVSLNDIVVTERMNDLKLGDSLAFDRIREIGSKDWVVQGNPYVHPSFFTVKGSFCMNSMDFLDLLLISPLAKLAHLNLMIPCLISS